MFKYLPIHIALLIFTKTTEAYYCEWRSCGVDQYCCGYNQCCNNVYTLWYFWAGIIIMLILLSSCGALIRFLYNSSRPQIIVQQITNYVPLPTEIPAQEENLGVYEDIEANQNYKTPLN